MSSNRKREVESVRISTQPRWDAYLARLKSIIDRERCTGAIVIVGVPDVFEVDDYVPLSPEQEAQLDVMYKKVVDKMPSYPNLKEILRQELLKKQPKSTAEKDYSEYQLSVLRYIIVNDARISYREQYCNTLIEGYGNQTVAASTASSRVIIDSLQQIIRTIGQEQDNKNKFDKLVGLTMCVFNYDYWYRDNDNLSGCQIACESLFSAWQSLLTLPDHELGIDSEYTRHGVLALLDTAKTGMTEAGVKITRW